MSNVEKLKKKAADFEAKRQIDKAIATYLDLFRVWDNGDIGDVDVALYNRVGDLLLREGNVGDAMSVWEKAVDYYGESGFHNNAIALCNKILRHSPGRTSIYYKLGKISAQKGFKGDAKKNYLEYADRMQKSNNMDEAFRALKEFADLCPDEDDIRQMLADQLSKAGRKAEAIEQLQVLYDRYEDAGDSDAAAATVERMKALDPNIEPKRAGGPRHSKETSGLVFIDLDAPAGRASRRSTTAVPQPPAPPPRQSRKTAAPPPPPPPPTPPAPPPPARSSAPAPRKTVPTLSKKLTGDIPLIDLDDEPAAPPPVERLEGLESAPEVPRTPTPAEGEQMDVTFGASFGTEETDAGDAKPIAGLESTSFAGPPGSGGRVTASLSSAADTTFGTLGTDDLALDDPNALGVGDPVFNTPAETIESVAPATQTPLPADTIPDPMPEFTLGDATETVEPGAEPAPTFDGGSLPLIDMDVAAEPAPAEPEAPRRTVRSTMSVLAQSVDLLRDRVANEPNNWQAHRELGEAMLEDGDRTGGLDELEAAMVGFESDDDLESARSLADEIIRLNPHSIRHHQKRVEYAVRMGDRARLIEAYIELADALFRAGQADKAKSVYQRVLELAPDDARALAALETFGEPEEVDPPPPADSRRSQHAKRYTAATPIENLPPVPPPPKPAPVSSDYVDLEDWLKEDDGPKSTRMVVEEKEPSGDEDADFADMLRKFKQGVAENVDEEDHESHYDLGVAYKEMGLVDEAIAEFQKALRGAHNRVRAYEALGQCFVERGQDQVATTILQRALGEPGVTDDQLIGVLYLLGGAAEALKHPADAVKYYQRVFAVDIKFRDVQKRMRALESAAR
jgi:tetratricopeptide (TPR) repeat protein